MSQKTAAEIAAEILIAVMPRIPLSTRDTPESVASELGKAFKILHQAVKESGYVE